MRRRRLMTIHSTYPVFIGDPLSPRGRFYFPRLCAAPFLVRSASRMQRALNVHHAFADRRSLDNARVTDRIVGRSPRVFETRREKGSGGCGAERERHILQKEKYPAKRAAVARAFALAARFHVQSQSHYSGNYIIPTRDLFCAQHIALSIVLFALHTASIRPSVLRAAVNLNRVPRVATHAV